MESGDRIGPYEIVARIGAGGMGEVFHARDTRLDRSVAVKVLPAEYEHDEQLGNRFQREARTISRLNHPHICTVHDVGEHEGTAYLVMELVEGELLADRIARGALSIRDLIRWGSQIAEGLDAAHRVGIVHRDLKPANVMIAKTGAKLLDFGLAKPPAVQANAEGATEHKPLTEEGTFVGTLQYMAPEQLEGTAVDARTDIFALGALLYEMATGRRAFEAKSKSSLIAAIVSGTPPPVRALQPLAPASLEHVIEKCLEKEPDERWQSAHDVAEELRWIANQSHVAEAEARAQGRAGWRAWAAALGIVALLAAAAIAVSLSRNRQPSPVSVARLSISLQPLQLVASSAVSDIAISPDGRRVAFVARKDDQRHLFLRNLDQFQATPLPGTEGATSPFFSPDGEWIGFFTLRGGLRKIRSRGGAAETVTTALPTGPPRGATWARDGAIYYATFFGGIWRIHPDEPNPVEVTKPDAAKGENSHRWPDVLPEGKHLLLTVRTDRLTTFDDASVALYDLSTGEMRTIVGGGTSARYLPTGHIVWARRGTLYGAAFDAKSGSLLGDPIPLQDDVLTDPTSGSAHYAIAEQTGTLVFRPGGSRQQSTRLERVDRSGQRVPFATIDHRITSWDVSPDETTLALQVAGANDDIWVYDIARGSSTRVSFEPGDEYHPNWTPDGERILFGSDRGLLSLPADGSGAPEALTDVRLAGETSISPDGGRVLLTRFDQTTFFDIWLLTLGAERALRPFLQTPYAEGGARFSPDGKWLAYTSSESGSLEVFVRSAEGSGGKVQVSIDGGQAPRWSRTGDEIYYSHGDQFYAASISPGATPAIEKPRRMFSLRAVAYEVFEDGFLIQVVDEETRGRNEIHCALGWYGELERID